MCKTNDNSSTMYKAIKGVSIEDKERNELGWNSERAKAWHKMLPPSKPSKSELDVYYSYFKEIYGTSSNYPRILILGSTVEFRSLVANPKTDDDCKFEVTVVDCNPDYYEEISKDLAPNIDTNTEVLIPCDWLDIGTHEYFKDKIGYYDIVIGDLAVGNISPNDIDKFFKNISLILKDGGYFLGKSIYKYSEYRVSRNKVNDLLESAILKLQKGELQKNEIYGFTMYDLSVFAIDNDVSKPIDFNKLYDAVNNFSLNKGVAEYFDIYLGTDTAFNSKMPNQFYIYDYNYLLDLTKKHQINLFDIAYGLDIYSHNFPLLIFKKGFCENNTNLDAELTISFEKHYQLFNSLNDSFSAQFFMIKYYDEFLREEFAGSLDNFINVDLIKTNIKRAINYELNDDFDFIISRIDDNTIDSEALAKIKLDNDEAETLSIQNVNGLPLRDNYIYGITAYEAYILGNCKRNSVVNALLKMLFEQLNNVFKSCWEPKESPWVAAKICICLYPMYKRSISHEGSAILRESEIKKLDRVVLHLASLIDNNSMMWHTIHGSKFDTSALCLEVLYYYGKHFTENQSLINNCIDNILKQYVLNNKIRETFIKYPIYDDLLNKVINKSNINNIEAYKKMSGRIEWYSMLYVICKDKYNLSKDSDSQIVSDYKFSIDFISIQLKRFWKLFSKYDEFKNIDIMKSIFLNTAEKEKCVVPQIIYCLKRSGALN